MQPKMLEMKDISKRFPGVLALDRVSLDLERGEVLGLLGENGAGKSTLMKILSGDYRKDAGAILINGEQVELHSPVDARQLGIRLIHQELTILDTLSVAENIFVGDLPVRKWSCTVDWKTLAENARGVLARLGVDISPDAIAGGLTVHEKQILEIARALSRDAVVLVMDEPTAALGEKETESLFEIVKGLQHQGVGIIYISHHLDEMFRITNRVTVLRDGRNVGTEITVETDKQRLVAMMVGSMSEFYPRKTSTIGEPLLQVSNLTIRGVFREISFCVNRGEVVGLFGLIGSGTINILRALYGIESIDEGDILVDGRPVHIDSPRAAVAAGIGFMPGDRTSEGLAVALAIPANITMANIDNLGGGPLLDRAAETAKAFKWMKHVNIRAPSPKTEVRLLSGGNQQKVVFAKLLETGSKLFLMDEPTRGIDVRAKADIYQLMQSLCESGAGILMMSSELPELLSMADRIIVVANGTIATEFAKGQAQQEDLLHAVGGA